MEKRFEPQKAFMFSHNLLCPSITVSIFVLYYFLTTEFSREIYNTIHWFFIYATLITLCVMGYFKRLAAFVPVSIVFINYLILNKLRLVYSEDYVFSSAYNIWIMLFFPSFLLGYYIFREKKYNKYISLFYIGLLLETALIEKLQTQSISTDLTIFYHHIGMMNYPAFYLSILFIMIMLWVHIERGYILNAMALCSFIATVFCIYLSDNLFAVSLFSLATVVVILTTSLYAIYYNHYREESLAIKNYNAYCRDAIKKYPLKYSISLLYIDEYNRLLKRFGKNKIIMLKKMIIKKIREINPEIYLYAYKQDAFILAFMNLNAKDCYEKAEDIRRNLAKSIFVFNENNHLQMTVSQCVSEEKRSDANATAVLLRAEQSLQKACRFTRNITVKA